MKWLLLTCIIPVSVFGQASQVSDTLTLLSKILKAEKRYSIYLPPGYSTSPARYPVLYLLHGGGTDHTGWLQLGNVRETTDKVIGSRTAVPMIIVMPDASSVPGAYMNHAYEDFFFTEFMPFIEKTYRIKTEKHARAIGGFSAGGRGAYVYALHRPDLFAVACPISAAPGPVTEEDTRAILAKKDSGVSPDEVNAYHRNNSVVSLVQNSPDSVLRSVRWYIDCGDEDFVVKGSNLHRIYEGNSLIHIAMCQKEVEHELRIRDGGHDWDFWRTSIPDVLKYISEVFRNPVK